MGRKTIIVGNGMSMALDPQHFSLANAIQYIWECDDILSKDERRYILQCLPGNENRPPYGEDELDTLHLAVTACGFLDGLSGTEVEWLSQQGQNFPSTIRKFVHRVATALHNYEGELPDQFIEPFCAFLKDTNSHVATLNYDRLLYDAMCDRDVLSGYDGSLVDGMWRKGFFSENLERLHGRDFGYYLHLHGSPLFYGSYPPKKMARDSLTIDDPRIGEHIVLTHVRHKPSVISASEVLSTYWKYLDAAFTESNEVIVFGYGGFDAHLNSKLKSLSQKMLIKVVEWDQSADDQFGAGESARRKFWQDRIGRIKLVPMKNVLEFDNW